MTDVLARSRIHLGVAGLATALPLGLYAALTHLGRAAWASAYGPICGHAAGQPHCAACYAALLAAAAGAGLLLTGLRRA